MKIYTVSETLIVWPLNFIDNNDTIPEVTFYERPPVVSFSLLIIRLSTFDVFN